MAAVRGLLVFLTLAGGAAFSPAAGLLAESPRPESDFDHESRGAQLEYLESIVEYYSPAGPEKTDALLGRLILRDDDPEHSAKHVLDHPHRDAEAIARKAIRCPKCRPIVDVVLGIARPPAEFREKDSSLSRALRARARELIDDGHGYVKRLAPGDGNLVRARVLLAAAIDDAPADWESLHLYGVVSDLGGRADDAEAAFRKAVNIRPRIGWTYNNLALFYIRHGIPRHAYYILRVARKSDSSDHRTARLLAWLHREPETTDLVSREEAILLMEEVLRREEAPEKRRRDEAYLAGLHAQAEEKRQRESFTDGPSGGAGRSERWSRHPRRR